KPILWRRGLSFCGDNIIGSFNLSREANPLATRSNFRLYILQRTVSISVEKPILWRLCQGAVLPAPADGFNLSREANPLATGKVAAEDTGHTIVSISVEKPILWRLLGGSGVSRLFLVSISVEKPILWRQLVTLPRPIPCTGFNLSREANP